jgi:ribonuclease Z
MRAAVLLVLLLGASRGLHAPRLAAPRPSLRRHATAVERTPVESAVRSLADVTLSLLAGNEDAADELFASKEARRAAVVTALDGFDVSRDGWLSRDEAEALFARLAHCIVAELADGKGGASELTQMHAKRVLDDDVRGTIKRVATKLYLLADSDEDGRVSLPEFAGLFDQVRSAPDAETFPQPLRALAGSLQLLPPSESAAATSAADRSQEWHIGVPGDDHTLRTVQCDGFSIVGIGRSADASAYFVPELGVCFDAGLSVASLAPRSVFLTHGHRDHTAALPVLARKARVFVPRAIDPLVRRFLIAEAQLNYGQAQDDAETEAFLGLDLRPVDDSEAFLLEPDRYQGSPTPLGLEVFTAPHKKGVPSCSYGLFRRKSRLKAEYQGLDKRKLGALVREDVDITEPYDQGVLFFSGDTTIDLLRERHQEILPKYETVIHEVTFLGEPSEDLDASTRAKGHTHYAQLHPWIAAFPHTTFVLVHWSLRYSKEEVLAFFDKSYGGVPKNVVLWI